MSESSRSRKMSAKEKREAIEEIESEGPWTVEKEREGWRAMVRHDDRGVVRAAEAIDGVAARSGSEPVTDETPMELAAEAERRRRGMEKLRKRYDLETMEDFDLLLEDYRKLQREEGADDLLGWFFADGWHPGKVLMRVYGLAMVRNPVLVAGMSQSELGAMVGRGRAAISARMKLIFPDSMRRKNGKSAESKEKMAKGAQGNENRKNGAKKKN